LACHHDEANRTEFPLLIDPTSIPNADTRNQAAFIVKAGVDRPHLDRKMPLPLEAAMARMGAKPSPDPVMHTISDSGVAS
jgi:hypothetical protein